MAMRVVLTGGPGAGKSSVLEVLARRGAEVASDAAREIIRERKSQGLPPRPSPIEFANEILRRDTDAFLAAANHPLTFFERGILDALGSLFSEGQVDTSTISEMVERYAYHPTVFVFPPWAEIYVNDDERDHPFEHAVNVFESTVEWYQRWGYETVEVPKATVEDRADFIMAFDLG